MDRNLYIGSSDAIDIMNGNLRAVWAVKTGRSERPEIGFKGEVGKVLEPLHLDWLHRDINLVKDGWVFRGKVNRQREYTIDTGGIPVISHVDDVLINRIDGRQVPVEVKHTCRFTDLEQASNFYMPQIQHHMMCSKANECYFSVIFGNDEPRGVWVGRSAEWIALYKSKVKELMDYIVRDEAPPADLPESGSIVPQPVREAITLDDMRVADMNRDNSFRACAHDYVRHEAAASAFNKAKDDLKKVHMPTDAREAYCAVDLDNGTRIRLIMKRTKAGVRFSQENLS